MKSLFTFIPRELIPNLKPDSMITLYTTFYDPEYRLNGNSYPVNFISELIWNFTYFSFIFSFLFGAFFNFYNFLSVYFLHRSIYFGSYFFTTFYLLFNVIRGSGLEYFVYGSFFIFTALIIGLITSIRFLRFLGRSIK